MGDAQFSEMLTLYVNDYDLDELISNETKESNKVKDNIENVQSQSQSRSGMSYPKTTKDIVTVTESIAGHSLQ